jgi:hypothetical protein
MINLYEYLSVTQPEILARLGAKRPKPEQRENQERPDWKGMMKVAWYQRIRGAIRQRGHADQ